MINNHIKFLAYVFYIILLTGCGSEYIGPNSNNDSNNKKSYEPIICATDHDFKPIDAGYLRTVGNDRLSSFPSMDKEGKIFITIIDRFTSCISDTHKVRVYGKQNLYIDGEAHLITGEDNVYEIKVKQKDGSVFNKHVSEKDFYCLNKKPTECWYDIAINTSHKIDILLNGPGASSSAVKVTKGDSLNNIRWVEINSLAIKGKNINQDDL